jgi:hypothetical protein
MILINLRDTVFTKQEDPDIPELREQVLLSKSEED